jgi:hypothetical protein
MAPEDILNSDETGIQVIPTYKRTLAKKGSKQVAGVAKKAIAQITKVSAVTSTAILLPKCSSLPEKRIKCCLRGLLTHPPGL